MENMIKQIDQDGIYQGAFLCNPRGSRDRKSVIFITSYNNVCGLVQRNGDLIKVEYLKKTHDPQWSIPFWSDDVSSSITDSIDDALRLIDQYFQNGNDPSTSSG